MTALEIATPRWAVPLLQPARYKGAHGGRGSGKSHHFAEALVERCLMRPTRWVCVREVQATIADSVRQLLIDKIRAMGVQGAFNVPKDREGNIYTPYGGMIAFRGMQSYNADNIKSLEDFDGAWVEEAQTLSQRSLDLLRPTIRKDGSELWFSWNPRFDTDPVDVLLRGPHKPAGAVVVEVNWQDNPWFPGVLRDEMEADYAADPAKAGHIWGGAYETTTEGAYFARYIAAAEAEGRIGDFPHDQTRPVITSWDIGVDDYTAIWFWQEDVDGRGVTVIDFYETQNDGAEQIVDAALPEHCADVRQAAERLMEMGRGEPYRYGAHFFPHDVKLREWGAGARSRIETLMGLGLRNIRKGAALGPEERIAAVRKLLPMIRFNETASVKVGLRHLRRYSRRFNEQMGLWQGPLHDEHSHGADAFGEYAVNSPLVDRTPPVIEPWKPRGGVLLQGAPKPKTSTRIRL